MNSAFTFIISNHNNDMFNVITDIMANWYLLVKAFIITINFYNEKNINSALLFIISNHNGRIVLSCLMQLEKCNDIFKVISDMALWYLVVNAFHYNHFLK